MMNAWETLSIIGVVIVCTFLTRALPFLVFKDSEKIPALILYLGRMLPMAIMFMLILYCIRSTSFLSYPYGIPELLGIGCVVILHLWKRNNMISIVGGTLVYMILVQWICI